MLHLEILNLDRQKFIEELKFTRKHKLYLAGGTALALQLGHRTSADFDFYTPRHFSKSILAIDFKKNLPNWQMKIIRDVDDTFEAIFKPNINISCFYYPYKLLKPLVRIKEVNIEPLTDFWVEYIIKSE